MACCCGNSRSRCWRVGKSLNTRTTNLSTKTSLAALQLSGEEHCGITRMRHGVFAASNRPWGSVIGVPTTTLTYSCSNSRCRCWRVGKSLNTRTIILSTKGSLAALQLRGVEHGGRDWMWQGILATGVGPWCGRKTYQRWGWPNYCCILRLSDLRTGQRNTSLDHRSQENRNLPYEHSQMSTMA